MIASRNLLIKVKSFIYIQYLNYVYLFFMTLFQRKVTQRQRKVGIEIHNSGLLGTRDWSHEHALFEVRKSHELLNNGRYFEGINRLIAFHESQYQLFADSNGEFYPPILSREWTNAFGHIPNIGSLIKLRDRGYLEKIPNMAILSSSAKDNPILETFGQEISFIPDLKSRSSWSQLPSFIHLFMGQNIIWTKKSGFIPFERLIDQLYKESSPTDLSTLRFNLPTEYVNESEELLRELGFFSFSDEEWFITLHVRNSGDEKHKIRHAELGTFQELIDEVGRKGGKVVRICNESTPTLPTRDFVLDCAKFPDRLKKTHLYFIAKSRLFVGTCSGPYAYPKLFGTPSLVVNATNIGRACFPSSTLQEYLPMRFFKKGKELSLSGLLQSPAGWADCSLRDLASMNLQPIPNSSSEIKMAFLSFFENIDRGQKIEIQSSQIRVNEIRSEYPWTSSGDICESFLTRNQSWLS